MPTRNFDAHLAADMPIHGKFSVISNSIEETHAISQHVLRLWQKHHHSNKPHANTYMPILLQGNIGAGKSVCIKHCLDILGLFDSRQEFSSPSFSIINEYRYRDSSQVLPPKMATEIAMYLPSDMPDDMPIYHIDLYRINNTHEADNLGIFDILYSHICFVEWPEKIDLHLEENAFLINVEIASEISRKFTISVPHAH